MPGLELARSLLLALVLGTLTAVAGGCAVTETTATGPSTESDLSASPATGPGTPSYSQPTQAP